MDYKKLYLEQKAQAIRLELQLLGMRAQILQNEMPGVDRELKEYASKKVCSAENKKA